MQASRSAALVLAMAAFVACASEPSSSSAPSQPNTAGTPGSESGEPGTGEEADGETFDLVFRGNGLDVQWDVMGLSEVELIVAVNDDTAGKRVAWKAKTEKAPASTFEFKFPGILRKGSSYRVALAGLATYSLFPVDDVSAEVVLDVDFEMAKASADKHHEEAYGIINTPLTLAPGTYSASLGADGTKATFIVGSKGGLVGRRFDFGCTGASACGGVSITSTAVCGLEFMREDTKSARIDTAKNKESLIVQVAPEGEGLRVKGEMKSAGCCTEVVDVVATKVSDATEGCE